MARDGGAVRPYVRQDAGTPENKWTALDGSLDWGAMFLWEYGVRNEAVCAACPQTVAALEALVGVDNRTEAQLLNDVESHLIHCARVLLLPSGDMS